MKNDMKSILSAFNNVGTNNSKTNKGNGDSMKTLLESLDRIQENVSINVSVSGESSDEVTQTFKSLNGGTASYDVPTATSSSTMSSSSDDDDEIEFGNDGVDDAITGTLSSGGKTEQSEKYNNEPEEEYQDVDDMVNANSGGINKRKKSYPRAEPGDNPMAVKEEQLKQELSKALKEHMKRTMKKHSK